MLLKLTMLRTLILVLWTDLFLCCHANRQPHIILIVADDLGWNDVSFHGSQQIPTPHIDKLAREGIVLNNYYVSPVCTPTRGSLMTGRHPIHLGLQQGVIFGSQPYGLPLKEKILPQWLQELGYRTHMIGKWHLGMFAEEYTPTRRGFESHYGYLQGAEGYFDHTYEATEDFWGLDWRRNDEIIRNEGDMYSTELFTKEAVNIINQHNTSQPLFLYLAHQAVHRGNYDDPLQAPQSYVDRFPHIHNYQRKMFAGMMSALDDSVGVVMDTLRSKGMLDDTLVVFTTDNGGPANGYDYNAANNFPLRGVKATLWEGGVRGVGFISGKPLPMSSHWSNHMMHVSDWLPTLYTAAGGNSSIMGNIDGYNMWTAFSTNQSSPRTEILHNIDPSVPNGALRVGDYKMLLGDVGMTWSDWYPPWKHHNDRMLSESHYLTEINLNQNFKFNKSSVWNIDLKNLNSNTRLSEYLFYEPSKSDDNFPQNLQNSLIKVHCGKKPFDASTNCNPVESPCLFNIVKDPCEYHNIASSNKDLVIKMLTRLHEYTDTMVPPGNKPSDPLGNPKLHNNTWIPWVKLK